MKQDGLNGQILEQLYQTIVSRKGGNPSESHTAKLFKKGRKRICKKFGEEAVEVVIAALAETEAEVVSESSDVLYHLLVLWAEMGIRPEQVWAELQSRVGTSGIEEKKNRQRGDASHDL
ncbi:MAG: phosphoribosyl-ATP diphosphatase [Rhodospirillales bacterium]|nr:phosphoribosyl-ATP diphosphatase [Rhodospirillales bacterium]